MLNVLATKRSTDGYTMVELLTILLMTGILVAIAAPSWMGLVNSQRAGASRDQILQTIRQAQADATRTKTKRTVQFNVTANPPTIQSNYGTQALAGTTNLVSLQAKNGTTTIDKIEFDKSGSIVTPDVSTFDSNGIKITVTSPPNTGKKRCVIIQTILGAMRSASDTDCN